MDRAVVAGNIPLKIAGYKSCGGRKIPAGLKKGSVPNTGRSIKSYMINFCIGAFLKLEWHLSILQRK